MRDRLSPDNRNYWSQTDAKDEENFKTFNNDWTGTSAIGSDLINYNEFLDNKIQINDLIFSTTKKLVEQNQNESDKLNLEEELSKILRKNLSDSIHKYEFNISKAETHIIFFDKFDKDNQNLNNNLSRRYKIRATKQKLYAKAQRIVKEESNLIKYENKIPNYTNKLIKEYNNMNMILGLKEVSDLYHLVDNNNSTLIRIFNLNNNQFKYLNLSEYSIHQYWLHTNKIRSYHSKNFQEKHYEIFGVLRTYTKLPYNSGDYLGTTSTCKEHPLYIDKMLDGIIPLADNVLANIIQKHYPNWYNKLKLVQYPKKVKKLFKVFSLLNINYNATTSFHIDANDNGLCVVVPVGNWTSGDLIFPCLNLKIKLVKGQVIMFRSDLLIHGNAPAQGIRFSMVFFSHKSTFNNN
ncbi:calnexin independence factor cif1 [Gigaspora margarita]|uniref:Calnexin independence factor cif1 n=1 Tax=Gigaspora margarita TaxID=4874 RepID=A0A8H4AD12_GIGMA|nr:calnexin independence factor cif1 [Gigaspora margarita]